MRRTLPAILLLFACSSDPASEVGELRLDTDDLVYFPGAPITATLSNRTIDVLFVSHCNYHFLVAVERRMAGAWTPDSQLNGPACLGIYPAGELRIEPRESVVESLTIRSEGEYRLTVYARRASQDFGDVVARSGPFTVRYPPD